MGEVLRDGGFDALELLGDVGPASAGLQAGTGRTYIAEELKRIDATVAEFLARGNLAIAAPGGEQR